MHGVALKNSTVQIPRSLPQYPGDLFAKWRQGNETKTARFAMALELCKHGDFFEFVSKVGRVSDQKLLKFLFLQICKGLNGLHTEAGKAHLDIKLENILVSEDGHLKLCDFGMVKPVDADISERHGTEMYMAPEIDSKSLD